MFEDFIGTLNDIGFYAVINPFILVFVICYAVLDKVKILGDKRDFKVSIALVVGLLCIAPQFTGVGPDFAGYLNKIAPLFAVLLCIIFLILLVIGTFGVHIDKELLKNIILLLVIIDIILPDILIIALIANRSGIELPLWLSYVQTSSFLNLLVAVLVFFAVVYFVTRDDDSI